MHDHDERRTTEDAAAEKLEHEHPARPEQGDSDGFAEGIDHKPDTPEEELEPNFARGISQEPPGGERHGRFSTGEEQLPEEDPEKNVERRFSEGIEESPTSR